MLPTSPLLAVRSMRSSCTTPEPVTATRVSCGVTLIRISSVTQLFEQLARLVERQAHDAGVAAAQLDDEARGAALDGVSAGLVVAIAARHVLCDLFRRKLHEEDLGTRQRRVELVVAHQRHSGQ